MHGRGLSKFVFVSAEMKCSYCEVVEGRRFIFERIDFHKNCISGFSTLHVFRVVISLALEHALLHEIALVLNRGVLAVIYDFACKT